MDFGIWLGPEILELELKVYRMSRNQRAELKHQDAERPAGASGYNNTRIGSKVSAWDSDFSLG
jgi:hypothetical protein